MTSRPVSIDERADVDVKVDSRQVGTDGGAPVVRQIVALGAGDSPDGVLDTSLSVPVRLLDNDRPSAFGETLASAWVHERSVGFHRAIAENAVTETITGAATGTVSNGQLTINVPVGGSYKIRMDRTVPYRSGHETRAMATAMFESAPASGVTALLWLWNEAEDSGFAVGHDNGNYLVRRRHNGTDTDVLRASWNHDEQVTRLGVSEALDLTKPQIFRLRFGWLGWAGLIVEARNYDPDESPWVLLHEFHFTQEAGSDASLSDPDVAVGFEVSHSGAGSAAVVRTNSWTVGPVLGHVGLIQPDNDIVLARANGLARDVDGGDVETSTPLSASGVYESGWVDSDGWGSIELFVATDQVSATDGVEVEFTDDSQATTPTVRSIRRYTFGTNEVSTGSLAVRIPTELDGFRVRYTNGGVDQGSFYLSSTLRVQSENPQGGLVQDLDDTNIAVLTRSAVTAPNASSQWANIARGANGGLDIGIVEHEVETPIKALQTWQTNQANVGTAAVQIVGSPLANRKTVLVKNRSDSTKVIYIGTSSSVTSSNGYELASGEGVELDLDPTGTGIWAIAASGTQRATWLEIGGT